MKRTLFSFFLLFHAFCFTPNTFCFAQPATSDSKDSLKILRAYRVSAPPKIDGILDEDAWKNVPVATDFIQHEPDYGQPSTQKTEVKIIYDNAAIYVGAFLYDTHPDSILHELGTRDQVDLNSDYFMVMFDSYNKLVDAYIFGVSASGVQLDNRLQEENYDAVWESAVKINDKGWCAEFKIPYSAIRFPNSKEQHWRALFQRVIRRNRELSRWTLLPKNQEAIVKYFGKIEGISDIHPPLRLSLTPYVSSYYEKAPGLNEDGTSRYDNSFSYNAGADIKYGINESFTVDMTLLPDFGQVQSDNKIKNLSYQEIQYEDYRPFFKEGTELFNKGMFYTRRIGKTPTLFYDVPDLLRPGETLEKNPAQTKLLNCTKISGRTASGTGIGLFNAVTDNTYAIAKDSLGKERKILTEPFTNYNAIVVDQQMKNSSNINFMNTNVTRRGKVYQNANVTFSSFALKNKKNTWALEGEAALSQLFTKNDSSRNTFEDQMGYKYYMGIRKTAGAWQYGLGQENLSSTFDRNDMGYLATNNFSTSNAHLLYANLKPWKSFLRYSNDLMVYYSQNFKTQLMTNFSADLNLFALFKSYASVWCGAEIIPLTSHQYYEPRVPGRFSYNMQGYSSWAGYSSDYRKRLAIDVSINTNGFMKNNFYHLHAPFAGGFEIKPRLRVSDKLSFFYTFNFNFDPNNFGFADSTGEIVTYGERKLFTYENALTAKYIFKNDLSFSLNGRHYWKAGEYIHYYTLLENGRITYNSTYPRNNNFSYNVFNIDAVFSWQFAPGSLLSLVYKNALEKEEDTILPSFANNFSHTLQIPQTNSLSLKVVYYLDYLYLKKASHL